MKKLVLTGGCLFALCMVLPVHAAIIGPSPGIIEGNISFDGRVDEFKDQSKGEWIDDGDGFIGQGDIIWGWSFLSSKTLQSDEQGLISQTSLMFYSALNGAYLGVGAGGNPVYDVLPVPLANANSLISLPTNADQDWVNAITTAYNAAASTTQNGGAMLVVLSKVGGLNPVYSENQQLDLDAILGEDGQAGTMNGWSVEMILGRATDADFWEVELTASQLPSTSATPVADETAGLSLLAASFPPPPLLQILADHQLASAAPTLHDAYLSSNVESYTNSVWEFQDDARLQINLVPEPASVLVWTGLLGAMAVLAVRRRRGT